MMKEENPIERFKRIMQEQGAWFYNKELLKQAGFIIRLAKGVGPVLILGASGTGKELLAKSIHALSPRRDKKYVPINCGSLNEETLLSELFGHVKGAYTGAIRDKIGAIEGATGGTLFLDEIGDLPLKAQVALLRFLNDGTYQRLGEYGTNRKSDVRILSATNKDLHNEIKADRFREDLYNRINVFSISMPSLAPLDERRAETAFKTDLIKIAKKYNYTLPKNLFTDRAFQALLKYNYPGNYREMENILEYALVKSDGETIDFQHLPDQVRGFVSDGNGSNYILNLTPERFISTINELIYKKFNNAYEEHGSDLQASKVFGMTHTRFRRILNKSREKKFIHFDLRRLSNL